MNSSLIGNLSSLFGSLSLDFCPTLQPFSIPSESVVIGHKDMCSNLSAASVMKLIDGPAPTHHKQELANEIVFIINMDPLYHKYFNIVVNYLPSFRILAASKEETKKINSSRNSSIAKKDFEGGYHAATGTIILPYGENHLVLREKVMHEWFHAAMHAVQIASTKSGITFSEECFSPDTPSEREKFSRLLQDEDAEVEELKTLLTKENQRKPLTKAEKNKIKKLREIANKQAKNYPPYPFIGEDAYPSKQEAQSREPLDSTENYSEYGLLKVTGYIESKNSPGKFVAVYEAMDPLMSAVLGVLNSKLRCKRDYSDENYFRERTAYLMQYNLPLVKALYPNTIKYLTKLLDNIDFPNPSLSPLAHLGTPRFSGVSEFLDYGELNRLLICDPVFFDPSMAKEILAASETFIGQRKHFKEVKTCLKQLINRGLETAKANCYLAEIAYREKDHHACAEYYKRCFKQGMKPNEEIMLWYCESLLKDRQYSLAEKQAKMALQNKNLPVHIREQLITIRDKAHDPHLKPGQSHGK